MCCLAQCQYIFIRIKTKNKLLTCYLRSKSKIFRWFVVNLVVINFTSLMLQVLFMRNHFCSETCFHVYMSKTCLCTNAVLHRFNGRCSLTPLRSFAFFLESKCCLFLLRAFHLFSVLCSVMFHREVWIKW